MHLKRKRAEQQYNALRAKISAAASLSRDGWAVAHRDNIVGQEPMWANTKGWTRYLPGGHCYSWSLDQWIRRANQGPIKALTFWLEQTWEPNDPKSALELLAEQLME